MPFSRSRSIESRMRSGSSAWLPKAPDCQSMASTSVVLPWSTWATIATSRRSVLVGTTYQPTQWPGLTCAGGQAHRIRPRMPERPGAEYCASFGPGRAAIRSSARHRRRHPQRGESHGLGHPRHTRGHRAQPRRAQRQRPGRDSRAHAADGQLAAFAADHHGALLTLWILYAVVRAFMQKWYFVPRLPLPDAVLLALRLQRLHAGLRRCSAGSCRTGRSSRSRLLSLPFLGLFRLTCYYYRKAYYRSFWGSPPACAVPDVAQHVQGRDRVSR